MKDIENTYNKELTKELTNQYVNSSIYFKLKTENGDSKITKIDVKKFNVLEIFEKFPEMEKKWENSNNCCIPIEFIASYTTYYWDENLSKEIDLFTLFDILES